MPEITVVNETGTIEKLQNGFSIARYGDGELILVFNSGFCYFFELMRGRRPQVFENSGYWFSRRLKKILISSNDNLLVGIPNIFFEGAEKKWKSKFWYIHKSRIKEYLNPNKIYYSAFFTRYNRKDPDCNTYWERLSKLWDNKVIAIVHFNREIVYEELFDNAAHVNFIECRRRNSWGFGFLYRSLLQKCLKDKSDMILLMVGPISTLLAYDLCLKGKQGIDIGQIVSIRNRFLGKVSDKYY